MMGFPRFYLISDRRRMGAEPVAAVLRLADAGLPAFQWREKDQAPGENYDSLSDLVRELRTDTSKQIPAGAASRSRMRLLVNDRCDTAVSLGIGVHLPENGIPTRVARRILPTDAWIGRSVHSIAEAERASAEGADFVTFGPVYDTPSKRPYGPPLGVAALRQATTAVNGFPVIALGGITIARVAECLQAGAQGVSAIGAIWDADDPTAAWEAFARELGI
jgi:thiamine-phosphate pyrophosphorylase